MFKWLQNIFSAKPAPVNPVKKSVPFDLGEVKASNLNMDWDITYEDRNGEITERRITVKSLHGERHYPKYAFAYCHLRKEPRHFNLYNIHEAYIGDTYQEVPVTYHLLDWIDDQLGGTEEVIKSVIQEIEFDFNVSLNVDNLEEIEENLDKVQDLFIEYEEDINTVKDSHIKDIEFLLQHYSDSLKEFNNQEHGNQENKDIEELEEEVEDLQDLIESLQGDLKEIKIKYRKKQIRLNRSKKIKHEKLLSDLNLEWDIVYENNAMEKTERRIQVKSVYGADSPNHIFAFCYQRKRVCQFNLRGILHAHSCETGEVVPITSNLLEWIKNQVDKAEESTLEHKIKEAEEQ